MLSIDDQTSLLMGVPPVTPAFIMPLINAYSATYPTHPLNFGVYTEPYYGDYNDCGAVLLTHNPGQANALQKGPGSSFDKALRAHRGPVEVNYCNLAKNNLFPNQGTVRWVNNKNQEILNLLNGTVTVTKRLFIRDLVPYHGKAFGELPMASCAAYLYNYFFGQVISSSCNSEIYRYLNRKIPNRKTTLMFARGSAWKNPQGLASVGWDFIGRIYSNCYVFKADFNKIEQLRDVRLSNWDSNILSHDIYIVVITPKKGGRVIIYKKKNERINDFNLSQVVSNYDTIDNSSNAFYISHNSGMDEFIDTIRDL